VEHYVTLLDSKFLPQGLALHMSLSRIAEDFTLWVLCIDDEALQSLTGLACSSLRPVPLSEIETAALKAVKPMRTRAEYCWTLTPFTPKMVFDRDPSATRVTYLDADVSFFKSPRPIFEEFEASGKGVLITEHAYENRYDQSDKSGRFCVQFVTFLRTPGEQIRQWWEDRCIEWCFARFEEGKFGDQKYLDCWPTLFQSQTHILGQLGAVMAPWNARRFDYSRAIAWHFHGLRLLDNNRVLLHSEYAIPDAVDKNIYAPYIADLRKSMDLIGRSVVQKSNSAIKKDRLKRFARRLLCRNAALQEDDVIVDLPSPI
jgi:hypothetical protein